MLPPDISLPIAMMNDTYLHFASRQPMSSGTTTEVGASEKGLGKKLEKCGGCAKLS
jgi:hypothetical protein